MKIAPFTTVFLSVDMWCRISPRVQEEILLKCFAKKSGTQTAACGYPEFKKTHCTENFLELNKLNFWACKVRISKCKHTFCRLILDCLGDFFAFPECEYLDVKQMKPELQTKHKILLMEAAADQCSATRFLAFSEYPAADMLLIKITG